MEGTGVVVCQLELTGRMVLFGRSLRRTWLERSEALRVCRVLLLLLLLLILLLVRRVLRRSRGESSGGVGVG